MNESRDCVVALGFFDGVHRGHQAVIRRAAQLAASRKLPLRVVTFDRRPKNEANGETAALITDDRAKSLLLRQLVPTAELVTLRFDDDLRTMTWETFAQQILRDELCALAAVCGEDFRFGHLGAGTPALLDTVLETVTVPPVCVDGGVVSSTRIRALLAEGKMDDAVRLLGHPYLLVSQSEHGDGRGASLGFATMNLKPGDGLRLLRPGVYASGVELDGRSYRSVTDLGTRPTFYSDGAYICETHIFDFSGETYGREAVLSIYGYLRPEMKFDSPAALTRQIAADAAAAKAYPIPAGFPDFDC